MMSERFRPNRRQFLAGTCAAVAAPYVLPLTVRAEAAGPESAAPRRKASFDFDWRFTQGDPADAAEPQFDDREWRSLDLPHDFSIEGPIERGNPSGARGGFFPMGTGWYRKQFTLPDGFAEKRVLLRFDGVMYFADVYLNGRHLGRESNPYLTRHWDITEHLDPGGTNTVAVRAEVPRQMERWYTGAGIYRHVWLVAVEPVRVREFGTYVTTPVVEPDLATVEVRTELVNETGAARSCILETVIVDPRGRQVAEAATAVELPVEANTTAVQELRVPQPRLWSVETPNLYRAISRVVEGEQFRDRYESSFGIRTIRFDAEEGFSLNGRQVLMRGVCLHQDVGGFGAAVPDRAIERRLEILRSMGVNAIRTGHNPYSIEFLELCDRMGFVVVDECFDKWHGFQPDGRGWRESLQRFLARDRNHPSVVLWSVGNEVGQQLRPEGVSILKAMVEEVRRHEPTRPVTCALRPRWHDGGRGRISDMAHHMDVVSLNYQSQRFEQLRREHPEWVLLGGETTPYYAMRTDERLRDPDRWVAENPWLKARRHACGQFLWTGCEYLGESRGWPDIGWWNAPIDLCGRRKPHSYFIESLYSDRPVVQLAVRDPEAPIRGKYGWHFPPVFSHWNWEGRGETLEVWTFTNAHSVELALNGDSLGTKLLADFPDRIIKWDVPNRPGVLRAVARDKNGKDRAVHQVKTAGEPARIALEADRPTLAADGQDLAHVEVSITDQAGTVLPDAERRVRFEIEGPGHLATVESANLQSHESFRGRGRTTYRSHALAVVRAGHEGGAIRLTATADGLRSATVDIGCRAE